MKSRVQGHDAQINNLLSMVAEQGSKLSDLSSQVADLASKITSSS